MRKRRSESLWVLLLVSVGAVLASCVPEEREDECYLYSTSKLEELALKGLGPARQSAQAELLNRVIFPSRMKEISLRLIEQVGTEQPDLLALAWVARARVEFPESPDLAWRSIARAVALAERSGRPRARAAAIYRRGVLNWEAERWEDAYQDFWTVTEIAKDDAEASDFGVHALNGLGTLAENRGARIRATSYLQRAVDQELPAALDTTRAYPATNLGFTSWRAGKLDEAKEQLVEAANLARNLEGRELVFSIRHGLADVELELGNPKQALVFLDEAALDRNEVAEDTYLAILPSRALAQAMLGEDPVVCRSLAQQAVDGFSGSQWYLPRAIIDQAKVELALGDPGRAANILAQGFSQVPETDHRSRIRLLSLRSKAYAATGRTDLALADSRLVAREIELSSARQAETEFTFALTESQLAKDRYVTQELRHIRRQQRLAWLVSALLVITLGLSAVAWFVLRSSRERRIRARIERELSAVEKKKLISEIEDMEGRLEQKRRLAAIGKLTGGVAHDFNNLLSVILSSNELLMLESGDRISPDQRELIEQSSRAAEVASQITSQLLADGRNQPLRPVVVDLRSFFGDIEPLLQQVVMPPVVLNLEFMPGATPMLARIDKAQLTTSLINLCSNASYAIGDQIGAIIISARSEIVTGHEDLRDGDYVRITTRDNGCGMTSVDLERAFEPFYTTKPAMSGTGLGLSTVYGFIRQSGGSLEIESEEGKGTTVTILIPGSEIAAKPEDGKGG